MAMLGAVPSGVKIKIEIPAINTTEEIFETRQDVYTGDEASRIASLGLWIGMEYPPHVIYGCENSQGKNKPDMWLIIDANSLVNISQRKIVFKEGNHYVSLRYGEDGKMISELGKYQTINSAITECPTNVKNHLFGAINLRIIYLIKGDLIALNRQRNDDQIRNGLYRYDGKSNGLRNFTRLHLNSGDKICIRSSLYLWDVEQEMFIRSNLLVS